MTIACNLPFHVYGYVDRCVINPESTGREPAVWFGVTLSRNRALGLTVLLENGAQYRQLPPHAWAFKENVEVWSVEAAQAWDCFGGHAQIIEYAYLKEFPVHVISHGDRPGHYLFTLEFEEDGFSRCPGQSKSLHAIELVNGRLTWQPNDKLKWHDASFTKRAGDLSWLRRQEKVWGVEN